MEPVIMEEWMILQDQDDMIQSFFKTTTEPYDSLEWDGEELLVILDDEIIERYSFEDLKELIEDFPDKWIGCLEPYFGKRLLRENIDTHNLKIKQ